MQPDDFRNWRKARGWKQKDAADRLGLKKRVIQYYEKGHREGKTVEIPLTVELACLDLSLGFERYDGGHVGKPAASRHAAIEPQEEPQAEPAPQADAPAALSDKPKQGPSRKRKSSAATSEAEAQS